MSEQLPASVVWYTDPRRPTGWLKEEEEEEGMQQGKNGGTIAQAVTYLLFKAQYKTLLYRTWVYMYNIIYYYISIQMFGSFLVFLIA